MVEPDALDHLLPAVRHLVRLPDAQRLECIWGERWIGYPRAQQALAKLHRLLVHPRHQRMPNLLIIGPTNNGKSMLTQKFCRDHLSVAQRAVEAASVPVLAVQMPSSPDIKRFYVTILHRVGIGADRHYSLARLETHALDMLDILGVRLLIIDEVHNILSGTAQRQREFLNLLRYVGNELKIALACVGIEEAYLAIRSDAQLENRFEPFILPRWRDDHDFASLLASFEAVLPLQKPSHLTEPDFASSILARTEGTIGEISTLLTQAAALAIETQQEYLDPGLLDQVAYLSPSERRRVFEQALR